MFKLGKYVAGNRIYVLTEISAVDIEDSTKYTVKTKRAKFYVRESEDTLVLDPEQDITTATELYNIIVNLNNMPSEEFKNVFLIYNNTHGTDYNFTDLKTLFGSGMTYQTLLDIYYFYMDTNTIKVGDIVRVILDNDPNSKYCAVLHLDKGENDTIIYTLYDADEDAVYSLTKQDAQIIRYNVEGKETAPIESLLNTIKENISEVTGDIDRTHDDPGENT